MVPFSHDDEERLADGVIAEADGTVDVHDQTGTNMINLRRTIYLTIMSALDFEEAVHKLLRIDLAGGQEVRLVAPCAMRETDDG